MKMFNGAALTALALTLSQVGPSVVSQMADAAGVTEVAAALGSYGTAEAAFIRRNVIKKSPVTGYQVVVVVGDDIETNLVDSVRVDITASGDSPKPDQASMRLPLRTIKANGNKRYVFNDLTFASDAVNHKYQVTISMLDIKGAPIGEPKTSSIEVEEDGDTRVRAVGIRQLDETNFQLRVAVVGDYEGEVASVNVKFSDDFEGPVPDTFATNLPLVSGEDGKRVFAMRTLSFDAPADAEDNSYNLVVDLLNAEGKSLGATEFAVVVEGNEVLHLQDDLEICLSKNEPLTNFANKTVGVSDEALELSTRIGWYLGGTPADGDSNDTINAASEQMNVLLHELRGLALEVTLD